MRHFIFVLLLFPIINSVYSQNYIDALHFQYRDQALIDSLMHKKGITRYIIYQTMMQGDTIMQGEDVDKIVSFLIWPAKNNNIYVKLISKNHVYNTQEISNTKIFNSKNLRLLWAEKREDNLIFVPPYIEPFNSEIIIYIYGNKKYFYEFGSLHYYTENKKKFPYRKSFIQLVKKAVLSKLKDFKVDYTNNR